MLEGMKSLEKRATILSRRSVCNDKPAVEARDMFHSGNGIMLLSECGHPFENSSCHCIMHRAQIAARLKDSRLVSDLLRFFLESGYVTEAFTTVHNPYYKMYMPDGQGAFPTITMER